MSPQLISFLIFTAVVLLLAISKRTRPLIMAVTVLWLAGHAVYNLTKSEVEPAILLLVVAAGITASAIRDRKKLIAQLKG